MFFSRGRWPFLGLGVHLPHRSGTLSACQRLFFSDRLIPLEETWRTRVFLFSAVGLVGIVVSVDPNQREDEHSIWVTTECFRDLSCLLYSFL